MTEMTSISIVFLIFESGENFRKYWKHINGLVSNSFKYRHPLTFEKIDFHFQSALFKKCVQSVP